MEDVRDHGIAGANAYHVPTAPYHMRIEGSVPDLLLRRPLIDRLAGVNARLADYGLELWVFDAWRPIAVQNHFHDRWMPDRLRALHPEWDEARIAAETERYWARGADGPIDPLSPPPHATGAAVDLTIRHCGGAELFMGTIFDDVSEASHTDAFEAEPDGLAVVAPGGTGQPAAALLADGGGGIREQSDGVVALLARRPDVGADRGRGAGLLFDRAVTAQARYPAGSGTSLS